MKRTKPRTAKDPAPVTFAPPAERVKEPAGNLKARAAQFAKRREDTPAAPETQARRKRQMLRP